VSPLLKSELRLRLGPQHCLAAIWRAGLRPHRTGRASASGANGESLETVLSLLAAQGQDLPRRATLLVEDEYVYSLLLPADRAWGDVQADALAQFAQMLGHDALRVRASLAPCGRQWIAVALEAELLEQWQEVLSARGIELVHVRPALLEDLIGLHESLRDHTGLVVLVRREGASVISVDGQTIVRIEWERCNVNDAQQLGARIEAQCLQLADSLEQLPKVCIVPLDSVQRAGLEPLCAGRGWQLSRALNSVPA
jgi:hypothetical protein